MKKTYQLYFLLSSWQGGECSRSKLYFLIFLYRYSSKPRVMESQQVVLKEEWILVYILSTLLKTQRFDYLSWWHLWHFGCLWLWNWRQTITFIAKEAGEMCTHVSHVNCFFIDCTKIDKIRFIQDTPSWELNCAHFIPFSRLVNEPIKVDSGGWDVRPQEEVELRCPPRVRRYKSEVGFCHDLKSFS